MSLQKQLEKAYERFVHNYRTDTGGINLYPEFDRDLYVILFCTMCAINSLREDKDDSEDNS